ncbi:MAG TPA: ABC transporter permease [Myxococcota bacterium]|nr:ABC transporter permease [Myxococcota bacterium]
MPWSFLDCAIRHRRLIARLTRARIDARYRGSLLGWLWMWVLPLLLLAVYTFVFGEVFRTRWGADLAGGGSSFALVLFCGLLIFGLFSECLNEAPTLLAAHQPYLKQLLFPSEILAWVVLGTAAVRLAVGLLLLLAVRWLVLGPPPLTVLWLPLACLPVALLALGGTWLISSLGLFVRDIGHGISAFTAALLFLSPVFYPVAHVPEAFGRWYWLNPLTPALESARAALFEGARPEALPLAVSTAVGFAIAWLGYGWFQRAKAGFVDVL